MYVCVCNAVTEDDVRGCMANGGCTTAREVKSACGMKPGCGSCTKRLHAMVSEYRTASELVDAMTGGPLPLEVVGTPQPEPVAEIAAVAELPGAAEQDPASTAA
jgi:bacterioferritin-associated ferredoxin